MFSRTQNTNWDIRNNHPINKDGPVRSATNGTFSSFSHTHTHTHTQTPPFSHTHSHEQWSQYLVNARERERETKNGTHALTHTHTRTIARDRLTGGALARVLQIEKQSWHQLVKLTHWNGIQIHTHTNCTLTNNGESGKKQKREGAEGVLSTLPHPHHPPIKARVRVRLGLTPSGTWN